MANIPFLNNAYFAGKVGIGTASPSDKLEVVGNIRIDSTSAAQLFLDSAAGNDSVINFQEGATQKAKIGYDNSLSGFAMVTGSGPYSTADMVILDSGNVGIGTTSPSQKLQVSGNSLVTGTQFIGDTFTKIQQAGGNLLLTNQSSSGAIRFLTNSTERVRIDSSGNVGIGTTSPSQKLEVIGNVKVSSTIYSPNLATWGNVPMTIRSDDYIRFLTSSSNSERMRILNNGNIGIGTTNPTKKLHVDGNTLISAEKYYYVAGGGAGFGSDASGNFKIRQNGADLIFGSGNNVGIGNTSPSQKLEVTGGNVKADEYLYNATDRTSSKNWKFLAAVNAGTYRELGSWRATEGNVVLRITVQSKTSGNSGTAVYMFQGGFNQAADGWYELVPAFKGGGHGNAQDGWKVLWYESTSYTFKIAVAVPTGLNNKNLNVSVEFLGDTEGDSYYQYNALTTTGTIPTYSLERTTSYSNRNLVSSDSITAQYDATNYTVLGYDYLDTYGGSQLFKVAGTERLRITSTGNVGIGTTSPGDKLEIGNLSNYTGLTVKGAGASRPAVTFKNATQSLLGAIYGTEGRDIIIETGGNGTTGTVALTLSSAGALKLNTYTAGTLVSDASGNITVSSGGGAGGPYLPLAGGTMTGTAGVIFPDNFNLNLGTSGDFRIFYNGNNAILQNTGGDIIFENTANDRDIFFKSDDGIGGVTTYFQLDGSQTQTVFYQNAQFQTNARLKLGNSGNLQMYHTSGISFIENNTGPLYIKNNANDQDIILQSDNGSGGVENYIQIDGSEGRTLFNKTIRLNDAAILQIGNDADLRLYHNGTNSNIENFTGTLQIIQNLDDGDISFKSDNGSGGTTEYFRLDGGSTMNVFSKPTWHGDGVKSFYGNSQDLQIFHDGSNSYVSDTGTGSLILTGTDLQLKSAGDEFFMYGAADGQVALYHNGTKKFETGGTGVTVIGSATATTFLGDLNGTINTATTAVTKANATNDTTVATTAFVQNLIGTIPAGLVFQGTWNAATNTPTLTSGSGTTGHFYIVSTDGSTNLDGITDWKVGDWAVFVEQGASDQWEKVDNSSVLDGSGTGQKVTKWDGSGTSNTLTDGPITFSGNNSTFAGSVTGTNATFTAGTAASGTPLTLGSSTQTGYTLQQFQTSAHSSTNAYLIAYGAGHGSQAGNFAMKNIVSSGEIFFELASGVEPLRMTSTGSTFAGALTIPDYIYHTGDANTKFGFGGNDSFQVNTSGAVAFSIDTAGDATFAGNVKLGDSNKLLLGASQDLQMYHNSADSYIENYTGNLTFRQRQDDGDIIFQSDNGSGGTATYFYLDGGGAITRVSRNLRADDSVALQVGSNGDAGFFHNGTDTSISNDTGDLIIQNNANDKDIVFKSDDGSGGIATYFRVDGGAVETRFLKSTLHFDNVKAKFGDSGDLQIYHDGSHSRIKDTGTGSLTINATDFVVNNSADTKNMIIAVDGGATTLFCNGANRLATTSTGVTVAGNISFGDSHFIGDDADDNLLIQGSASENVIIRSEDGLYFRTGGDNTRLSINSSGNVGIGTTSPSEKLHVDGNIRINSGTQGVYTSFVQAISSTGLKIGNDDYSGYAYFHNDGNVGIGTTSPDYKFEVQGVISSADAGLQKATFANVGNDLVLTANADATNATAKMLFNSSGSGGAVVSTKMIIDGSGNVGIGTTSPVHKLTVNAPNDTTAVGIDFPSAHFDFSANSTSGYTTSFHMDDTATTIGSNSTGRALKFQTNNTDRLYIKGNTGNVGIGTTSPGAKLDVTGSYGDVIKAVSGSQNITTNFVAPSTGSGRNNIISTAGKFNIGTSDAQPFSLLTGSISRVSILSGGNVGIGTTSPSSKLEVEGTGELSFKINNTQYTRSLIITQGGGYSHLKTSHSSGVAINYGQGNAGILSLFNNTTQAVKVNANGDSYFNGGNVGIGTTSPTNKLHIQGSQATVYNSTDSGGQASAGTTINNTNTAGNTNNFSQLLFTVGTNNNSVSRIVAIRSGSDASDLAFVGKSAAGVAEYMRIKSGGNVGIGTTSPSSSLEVLKSASSTTISEARISSLVTSGYGGQANLWLRTSNYGNAMLAFGNQVGSSTVASSASGKISYNTYNRIFTVTADSNALLTLGGTNDRVGINQTNPQYTLDVTGNGKFTSTVTATNFINSSDERLKENIEEVCNNNVEVSWKTFNFKTEKEQKRYGVIAQELEKTNPEFVREDSKGFKSVAYIDLLIAKIAELEARIQKLEK